MSIILYEHPDSPNCHKVRLLAAALELPYERRHVDLHAGATRSPAFSSLNPAAQIPVLVDGALVLPESNAILCHLAERYAPELRGADPHARATVDRWLFWQAAGATRPAAGLGYQRLIRPARGERSDEGAVTELLGPWTRTAAVLERCLAERPFVAGSFSVADIAIGVWVELADRSGFVPANGGLGRWLTRLQSMPFWSRAPGYEILSPRRVRAGAAGPALA